MHSQEGKLDAVAVAVVGRLPPHGRPGDDDVAEVGARTPLLGRKREHVGWVVVAQKTPVQAAELLVAGDPDGDVPTRRRQPCGNLRQGSGSFDGGANLSRGAGDSSGVEDRDHQTELFHRGGAGTRLRWSR